MGRALLVALVALSLSVTGSVASGATPQWTAWLCFPGEPDDWCSVDLTTEVFTANGSHRTVKVSVPDNPPIDCFYVYPTVSEQRQGNADLKVHAEERETAITQAAQFSHVCRVYAPLYRQTTAYSQQYHGSRELAYNDVLAAWHDYLARFNKGRGVVLIGHSQGASHLKHLITDEIDSSPTERKLLVSAILLGGDVLVARGSNVGGDFQHVPACTSRTQTACVVAYGSWDRTPPWAGQGKLSSSVALCVNPAALGGGSAPITPIFAGINPQGIVPYATEYVTYHWVEFPGLYTARCVTKGNDAWLLVTRVNRKGDDRPTVIEALGPDSGLHAADVNMTLANLVGLVASQSRAWLARR